ncbi:MAG: DNA-binding response regulator, partial [Chitinophagaceae bacterium]
MKYSCIIIDDNEIEGDLAEIYLKKIGSLEIKAVCRNSFEALKILSEEK